MARQDADRFGVQYGAGFIHRLILVSDEVPAHPYQDGF
jgi:hypothetical protein